MKKQKVIVLGVGVIGLSVANYLAQFKQYDVHGFDVSSNAVQDARLQGIKSTSIWEELPVADVYIICVSTGLKGKHPDMSQIFDAGENIKRHLGGNNNPLISVESTVVPGTCRRLYEGLNKAANLVHVPHRYWLVDSVNYGVKQKRILGAIDQISQIKGVDFYSSMDVPVDVVTRIEIAEMTKIVENAYRFVEIAFAEELSMLCKEYKIDFEELRKTCNTLIRKSDKEDWRVQILEARNGIGGHCLPKDIRYLLSLVHDSKLIKGAIAADKSYKRNLSNYS